MTRGFLSPGVTNMSIATVSALWRYPVKSMGGEQLTASNLDQRALHGDRLWAVRDLELDAVTTARRLPALLGCTARFLQEPPPGVGPGDVCDVVVQLPDGREITTVDRERLDNALSELTGKPVALVPLPPMHDKAAYRGVRASKTDLRLQWDLADDAPLPDLSMFPLRKLAQLAIYATPIGTFADAYAVHLLTTSSLKTMAEHGGDFDVRRFRPNIVLDTPEVGLAEQRWLGGVLTLGQARLRVEIPSIRCSIPMRAQPGLDADPSVTRTMSAYAESCLGVYTDIVSAGTIQVGDLVTYQPAEETGTVTTTASRLADRVRRNVISTGKRLLP